MCVVTHLNVNDEIVERATVIKYLGAWAGCSAPIQGAYNKKCQTAIINYL